jgi:hypothetical protein
LCTGSCSTVEQPRTESGFVGPTRWRPRNEKRGNKKGALAGAFLLDQNLGLDQVTITS